MDNFIDKILDEYYSRKLAKRIRECVLFNYSLDERTIFEKNVVRIQIKKKKYRDDQYYTIFDYKYDEALGYLISFNNVRNIIENSITCYFENEK